jgi:hypothetical protein
MTDAKAVFATLSAVAKSQHQAAWCRIESRVRELASKPINGKKPKVFEVHHAIEHARGLYFAELVKGMPSDSCERAVDRAYGLES